MSASFLEVLDVPILGGGKLTPLLPPTTCNEKEINLKDVNSWEKIYLNASVQLTQELLS